MKSCRSTADLQAIDRGNRIQSRSATALMMPRPRHQTRKRRDQGDGRQNRWRRTTSRINYADAVRATEIAEAIVNSIIMVSIEASACRDNGGEHALIFSFQGLAASITMSSCPESTRTARRAPALPITPQSDRPRILQHIETNIDLSTSDALNAGEPNVPSLQWSSSPASSISD